MLKSSLILLIISSKLLKSSKNVETTDFFEMLISEISSFVKKSYASLNSIWISATILVGIKSSVSFNSLILSKNSSALLILFKTNSLCLLILNSSLRFSIMESIFS